MPIGEMTAQFATLEPPPRPTCSGCSARWWESGGEQFLGTVAGTVPILQFFSPEHLEGLIVPSRPVSRSARRDLAGLPFRTAPGNRGAWTANAIMTARPALVVDLGEERLVNRQRPDPPCFAGISTREEGADRLPFGVLQNPHGSKRAG
jgi:hypothetical protein